MYVYADRSSLRGRCRDAFEDEARAAGEALHDGGRALLTATLARGGEPARLVAQVDGGRRALHRVELWCPEPPAPMLQLSCDCDDGEAGEPCAHAWAALSVCDALGARPPGVADGPLDLLIGSEGMAELLPALDRNDLLGEALGRPGYARFEAVHALRWAGEQSWGSNRSLFAPDSLRNGSVALQVQLDHSDPHTLVLLACVRDPAPGVPPRLLRPHDPADAELLGAFDEELPFELLHGGVGLRLRTSATVGGTQRGAPSLLLLRALCDRGQVLLGDTPLAWPAASCVFEVDVTLVGSEVVLRPMLAQAAEDADEADPRLDLACARWLGFDGLAIVDGRLSRFDPSAASVWLDHVGPRGVQVPRAELPGALRNLSHLEELSVPRLDPRLGWSVAQGSPVAIARFSLPEEGAVAGRLLYAYGDDEIPARSRRTHVCDAAARQLLLRSPLRERDLVEQLAALGVEEAPFDQPADDVVMARDAFPALAAELTRLGWRVEAQGRRLRSTGSVEVEVVSGVDWFDLKLDARCDGIPVAVPELLDAVRRRRRFVVLDDGSCGMLPEAWLDRFAPLAENATEVDDEGVRFRRVQGGVLDAVLETLPEATVDDLFAAFRHELKHLDRVRPEPPPARFAGTLRPYQQVGLGWLRFLRRFGFGGCLADDMGLGKTVQVLAMLLDAHDGLAPRPPSLIVAPRSLVSGWLAEAARFAPDLRVVAHHAGDRDRELAYPEADLVVTTYGTLLRDEEVFASRGFHYVILDEAQNIKNPRSKTAAVARRLVAEHRLALTGTPVENSLADLGSIMEFVNPGMIASARAMHALAQRTSPGDESLDLLSRALRPFLLRRTKAEVLPDLPAKTEQSVSCRLRGKQRRLYDELRRHYRDRLLARIEERGMARSKVDVLEALLRLRQAACHPGLLDPKLAGEGSAKLDQLLDQLLEVTSLGHKAIVFSQFVSFLTLVRARLDAAGVDYAYLDGSTTKRAAQVDRFQEDAACKVFLISLRAGGNGLNLTAGEYVFLLDPWWNPAVEAQAIDRAHRIGQERPVFAYRLIAEGTVEEKVLALQESKRALAQGLLAGKTSFVAGLDPTDLDILLS